MQAQYQALLSPFAWHCIRLCGLHTLTAVCPNEVRQRCGPLQGRLASAPLGTEIMVQRRNDVVYTTIPP